MCKGILNLRLNQLLFWHHQFWYLVIYRDITLEESGGVQNGTWTPFLDRPHRACLEPSKFDLEERKSFTWAHNTLFQNRHFGPVQNGLF